MENQNTSTQYQRVTPEMIPHLLGRSVCLVGKFKSFRDGVLCLVADNSTIQIVDIDEFPETNDVLEIRGRVNERGQIEAQEYSTFRENFGKIQFIIKQKKDLALYQKVVQLMQGQFKDLFYD